MSERSGPRPILGRAEGIKNARSHVRGFRLRQQAIVSERRNIHGPQNGEHRVSGFTGHGEAMIEAAAAGPCRGNHEPIEYGPVTLIAIEAVAHKLAQKTRALRIPI